MPGKKILVADDSLTIQKVIRLALSNEGYEIQAVSEGNDAIQQITLTRPDIVLIDVSLPGKNAFEVKREVNTHQDLEEIRFILMSSAFEKIDEPQATEVGIHGRLTKPFDPAHLRQILIDVLAQVTAKRQEKTTLISSATTSNPLEVAAPELPPIPSAETLKSFENHENWVDSPVKPDELPPLPASPEEMIKDLWGPDGELDQSSISMPSAEELMGSDLESFSENEDDIQGLTESTMKISGMDDYEWSVTEPSLEAPSQIQMPPLPHSSVQHTLRQPISHQHNSLAKPSVPFELEIPNDNFPKDMPLFSPENAETSIEQNLEEHFVPPPPLPPPLQKPVQAMPQQAFIFDPSSQKQIEKMIREQVESTLLKMIQNHIPDIAEKLIKQEINKILSE